MTEHAFLGRTCGDCVFHDSRSDDPKVNGRCLRFPPTPLIVPRQRTRLTMQGPETDAALVVDAFFPVTMNGIPACGEYRPAEGRAVQ